MRLVISLLYAFLALGFIFWPPDGKQKKYPVDPALGFSTGPAINEKAPEFSLADQNGRIRSLKEMVGRNGALLLFYRSSSW